MPIEGFDYKEFSKSLAEQVGPALPSDISDVDKQYVVNIVYNFCHMAGEAISNDAAISFNVDQANMVTQFIGEWTFHKAIDTIRSGIDPQFRDGILQKIAFTVYEIAKTAIVKGMTQGDIIAVVELQVKKAYQDALQELQSQGLITSEQVDNASNQSNIDDMAKAAANEQLAAAQQGVVQNEAGVATSTIGDNKILKLATFAIILRKLPVEKRQVLVSKFNPEDAQMLLDYANMDDLENKLDKSLIMKCLNEIKSSLPAPKRTINANSVYDRLYKIVKNSNLSKISNIINKERVGVKTLIMDVNEQQGVNLPPLVADVICTHLQDKLKV